MTTWQGRELWRMANGQAQALIKIFKNSTRFFGGHREICRILVLASKGHWDAAATEAALSGW